MLGLIDDLHLIVNVEHTLWQLLLRGLPVQMRGFGAIGIGGGRKGCPNFHQALYGAIFSRCFVQFPGLRVAEQIAQLIRMGNALLNVIATKLLAIEIEIWRIKVEAIVIGGRLGIGQTGLQSAMEAMPKDLIGIVLKEAEICLTEYGILIALVGSVRLRLGVGDASC